MGVHVASGLFLWAAELSFVHPITGARMDMREEPPNKFVRILEREQAQFNKLNPRV